MQSCPIVETPPLQRVYPNMPEERERKKKKDHREGLYPGPLTKPLILNQTKPPHGLIEIARSDLK